MDSRAGYDDVRTVFEYCSHYIVLDSKFMPSVNGYHKKYVTWDVSLPSEKILWDISFHLFEFLSSKTYEN